MSLLIHKNPKTICQGFSGTQSALRTEQAFADAAGTGSHLLNIQTGNGTR